MGYYITLCTVHTTQEQAQAQGIIVFYCTHSIPCSCPGPHSSPVQCVQAIIPSESAPRHIHGAREREWDQWVPISYAEMFTLVRDSYWYQDPLFPMVPCHLPCTALGSRSRGEREDFAIRIFTLTWFLFYLFFLQVSLHRSSFHTTGGLSPGESGLSPCCSISCSSKFMSFSYRNVEPRSGKLSIPFQLYHPKIFLTLAIKIYLSCVSYNWKFSAFFDRRQPYLPQKYCTIDLNLNSHFRLVSRRKRAWRVRSDCPRMTSLCCSRRACTSSQCPSSSTWRPMRWSSSSPSSRRSPSPSSGASSSGCAAGECVTSSYLSFVHT